MIVFREYNILGVRERDGKRWGSMLRIIERNEGTWERESIIDERVKTEKEIWDIECKRDNIRLIYRKRDKKRLREIEE